ncbi:hypothetical protein JNW90_32595 [Micromonospora sp. STR1s_5]|nr:hypothetical protein [Micromonospora sp. STR1s_5]
MPFTATDIAQILLSLLLYLPLLVLPGLALAFVAQRSTELAPEERLATGLVLAFAVLPAVDSMAVRFAGLTSAVALNLALAAAGIAVAAQQLRGLRLGRAAWAFIALWILLAIVLTVDFDWEGKLFQSTTVIDMVKHTATTQAILATGAPPADPFFARDGVSGYYYFFYTLPALAARLGLGWLNPRAAVTGLIVWTGIALFCLAKLTVARAQLAPGVPPARLSLILAALLFATGLDVLPVVSSGLGTGPWPVSLEAWNEQVSSWVSSCVWVPHHVSALIASWAGLMLLAEEIARIDESGQSVRPSRLVIAATALVSALGLSVWVTLAAVLAASAWALLLAYERRWRALGLAILVGVAAIILAIPTMLDLVSNRAFGAFPVAPTIRAFFMWDAATEPGWVNLIGRLVLLPLNYMMEFGIFLVGSVAFWAHARRTEIHRNEVARVLTVAAIVSLLLATFTKSVIINNDLGWRVMLFPQFAALLWTASAIARGSLALWRPAAGDAGTKPLQRLSPGLTLAGALLVFGYLGVLYDVIALRAIRRVTFADVDPRVTRELRIAYSWTNGHLPATRSCSRIPALPASMTSASTAGIGSGLRTRTPTCSARARRR